MFVYGGMICLTTALAYIYQRVEKKKKTIVFILLIVFPSLLAGLRGVGTDYWVYKERFQLMANGEYQITTSSLIYFLMQICSRIGIDYQILIFLIASINILVIFYIICKYEKYISVPYAVFAYMTMYYQMSFNIFRQILAASILLLAFYYLIEKNNKIVYWVLFIIAAAIHSASILFGIIFFILPIVQEKKYLKVRVICYCVVTIIVFNLPYLSYFAKYIADKFPHYGYYLVNLQFQEVGFGIFRYLLLVLIPIVCLTFFYENFKQKVPLQLQHYVFLCIIGMILWFTSYTSNSDMYRVGYYGLLAVPILLGFIKKNAKKNKIGLILLNGITVLLMFFWYYDYIYMNSCATYPYKFFT